MMKAVVSLILLLVWVMLITPPTVLGQRRRGVPVVAKFGGECRGESFRRSARLERLIRSAKGREASPCDSPFCEGGFAFDLNGDGRREYFVRLGCGATGNCTWGIFSDHPARARGTFTAWFFYVHGRAGGWSNLSAYVREGGQNGVVSTLANRKGRYVNTSERDDEGYYGNSHPFLKRMGVPACEFSKQ